MSANDKATILELLVLLLTPIGEHRYRHIVGSRGKRAKRNARKTKQKPNEGSRENAIQSQSPPVETLPEISRQVTIGFNSTMHYLEDLAHKSTSMALEPPAELLQEPPADPDTAQVTASSVASASPEPLAAVFVPHSDHSSELFAHLPILVRAGSRRETSSSATRLVMLPRDAEAKLSSALHIPRVGVVGLKRGALMASELLEMVRARVPLIEVPWFEQAIAGTYMPLKIEQTTKGKKQQLKRKAPSGDADVEK